MGWFSSDVNENEAIKTSDTTGNISNNIIFGGDDVTYVEIILLIIAVIKFAAFVYIIYTSHIRRMKIRYGTGENKREAV